MLSHISNRPRVAYFFQNQLFRKILSGLPSECQTDWIQIRPDKTFAKGIVDRELMKIQNGLSILPIIEE